MRCRSGGAFADCIRDSVPRLVTANDTNKFHIGTILCYEQRETARRRQSLQPLSRLRVYSSLIVASRRLVLSMDWAPFVSHAVSTPSKTLDLLARPIVLRRLKCEKNIFSIMFTTALPLAASAVL